MGELDHTRNRLRAASLVFLTFALRTVASAAPLDTVHAESVDLFEVARIAAAGWPDAVGLRRLTFPHVAVEGGDVVVELYDSKTDDNTVVTDNCVASPRERVIDCDLAMIDRLIAQLRLGEVFGGRGGDTRHDFRLGLLSWILAHEMGHVVLNHGMMDFDDRPGGFDVFSIARQRQELAADAYAVHLTKSSKHAALEGTIIDLANASIRKALCPETFPKLYDRIPAGVGLIYDYNGRSGPIIVPMGNTHPALLARFLRMLYLAPDMRDGVGYEARRVIETLRIEGAHGEASDLKAELEGTARGPVSGPSPR